MPINRSDINLMRLEMQRGHMSFHLYMKADEASPESVAQYFITVQDSNKDGRITRDEVSHSHRWENLPPHLAQQKQDDLYRLVEKHEANISQIISYENVKTYLNSLIDVVNYGAEGFAGGGGCSTEYSSDCHHYLVTRNYPSERVRSDLPTTNTADLWITNDASTVTFLEAKVRGVRIFIGDYDSLGGLFPLDTAAECPPDIQQPLVSIKSPEVLQTKRPAIEDSAEVFIKLNAPYGVFR